MKRLRKFVRLPANDRRLVVKSALLLGVFRLGLWVLPFGTLRRMVLRVPQNVQPHEADPALAGRIAWAVEVASLYVPKTTCLVKAFAAHELLAREGLPVDLRIGVTKSAGTRFQAHAWVETQGKVVIGGDPTAYTPLPALEATNL